MKRIFLRPFELFRLRQVFLCVIFLSLVLIFLMFGTRLTQNPKKSWTPVKRSNGISTPKVPPQSTLNINKTGKSVKNTTIASNYSCLYSANVKGKGQTWRTLQITIKPTHPKKCKARSLIQIPGGTTFRVQALGVNEIVTGDVQHKGKDIYTAKLILTFTGEYTVMVIITYINNQSLQYRTFVPAILDNIKGTPFKLTTTPGLMPGDITRYCTQRESGLEPGRWVLCGSIPGIENCGEWELNKDYDFDKIHHFHWLPYRCQLHHYTDDQIKQCFAVNRWTNLTLTGDSHSRYRTYHWATRLYGTCQGCIKTYVKTVFEKVPRIEWVFDARGTRWPLVFPNISRPQEIYVNPSIRRSMFSQPIPSTAQDAQVFIINFGHWILREATHTHFIYEKMNAFVEAIKTLKNTVMQPIRVIFVNTMALPWRNDKGVIEWVENLSPSRVKYLNKMVDKMVRDNDIELLDAFQISTGRVGATHDQTHYAKRFRTGECAGVVENTISNVIANILCNPMGS